MAFHHHWDLTNRPFATQQTANQGRPYGHGYLPNGAAPSGPTPGATPLLPNQGRIIHQGSTRILCIADVRGNLRSLNELAAEARANIIIHTGDFGFYDDHSIDRIAEKTLRHVAQYSPLLSENMKKQISQSVPSQPLKERFPRDQLPLSELPMFLNKTHTLNVPVYTVWGACEDVQVLEKIRSGEYNVHNLHVVDESMSRLLEIGGVKLRLLGLGGALVMHKLFDNGEGRTTIAGGQGTMWTTLLQMGELVDTANRVYDPTETRIFITHASPAREGLLNQLAVTLKADFSISAGLHFRYGSSYNEFSVNPTLDHYRGKLAASKASFNDVWETVKTEVEPAISDNDAQQQLLQLAIEIISKMPSVANGGNPFGGQTGPGQVDESAFKNMWNFNLADAAYGWLVLDIQDGRIGTEMRAQGFNFSHRGKGGHGAPAQSAPAAAPVVPVSQPRGQQGPPPAQHGRPQQASPSQPRAPGAQQMPLRPSPGPKDQGKPTTPQQIAQGASPGQASATPPATEKGEESKLNGTASGEHEPQGKTESAPRELPKIFALFVRNGKDEEVRNIVSEVDRPKIIKMTKAGMSGAHVLHFSSVEETTEALDRIPEEFKRSGGDGKPAFSIFRSGGFPRGYGGRGPSGSGYRSGGASDSEGGRGGRGAFRGRGDRGRGRGRGGRGGNSANKEGGSAAASPAPTGGDS
ncbi:hypothetical protein P152DRAFT_395158 [Eremomyces bilateralis CBS 781.70]|uniref:DUF2433 domain-containing protein n=1 Tax=Eremomyces bilateralis CBS 781.70 TaxID=1392243 RepID=A0A6G1G5X1_9PEZI|nr:uncharacterized protein P152DRAFT_395158 [Eremomyces bilateralis CBS 781.70]KAF1813412.1 hypothetical protein P152DRAFT_395158 [Eremomyces bilateralis CBS 781.70]